MENTEYNVYAIIPKDMNLEKCFITICKKELKFKEMYYKALEKINYLNVTYTFMKMVGLKTSI